MHHAHHAPHTVAEDDSDSTPEDHDIDDKWNRARNVTDVTARLVTSLPSAGYRILEHRTSVTLPPEARDFLPVEREKLGSTLRRRLKVAARFSIKNWSNILLVFVPAGVLAPHLGWSDSVVFVLNCLAVIPLADKLCWATDQVSRYLGETTGALLNITMGNAAEMILFINALMQRQYIIVRTSLLGSIMVNQLLVLGLAIITGELQQRGQKYSIFPTRIAAALLCLTTVSLLVPSTIRTSSDPRKLARDVLDLSRGISIVLIVVYMLYLWTQMRSSKFGYAPLVQLEQDATHPHEPIHITEMAPRTYRRRTLSYPRQPADLSASARNEFDELPAYTSPPKHGFCASCSSLYQRIKKNPWMLKFFPVIALLVGTAFMSICGGYLVDSIDHVVTHSPLSRTMVGLIILPLVGNAAELVSGVLFASRKQMDLAFAVSIGSAIQIALFVTPSIVVAGWFVHRAMALHFTVFEAVSLIASTVSIGCLILDNKCSMLKGVGLVAGYTIIALAASFVPNSI